MTTDLEDLIRTTLAERAEDAPAPGRAIAQAPRPTRTRVSRRWVRGLAATGLAGALAVTGLVIATRIAPSETRFEPAMSFAYDGTPRSAEAYRLVLDAPGWAVPDVDGSVTDSTDLGGILYEAGTRRLEVSWGVYDTEATRMGDSFDTDGDGVAELPIEVLGQEAIYWRSSTQNAFRVLLPLTAGHYQVVTGTGMSQADFEQLLGQLRWADQTAFDATLPERYLTTPERPAVISELLSGVPLPESYDADELTSLEPNRYHLALDLARGAVCVWAAEWQDATEAGDEARAGHAEDVLARAGTWPMDKVLDGNDTGDLLDEAPTVLDSNDRYFCG